MEITHISEILLLLALLLLLGLWYIYFYTRRQRLYELAAQFNGPKALPFIGNILKCNIPLSEISDALLQTPKYYKSPVRFWFGGHLVIYIWDPEDVKIVLNSPAALNRQPLFFKMTSALLGNGLITLPVNEWKRHRKLITPIFNLTNIRNSFDIANFHSKKLVKTLQKHVGGQYFDAKDEVQKCVLNIVWEFLLHLKASDVNSNLVQELTNSIKRTTKLVMKRFSNILYLPEITFGMTSVGRQFYNQAKKNQQLYDSIVEHWKTVSLANSAESLPNAEEEESRKPTNFVQHLLSTSDEFGRLSMKELGEEINTFILAAFETTASIMGYFLLVMGIRPDVQEQLYNEIIDVESTLQELTYEDLKKFTYLERVIKETLRLFPIVAGILRYAEKEIPLTTHTIPAGVSVAVGLLNLHRDPNIWPNPTHFDPERFLPEEEAKHHPYSWIPFSGGPRNCIGLKFALMNLKVMAINIVKHYRIETTYKNIDEVQLTMEIVLQAAKGFNIKIASR